MRKRFLTFSMVCCMAVSVFSAGGLRPYAQEELDESIETSTEVSDVASETDAIIPEEDEVERENASSVAVTSANFEDANFRKYLNNNFAVNGKIDVSSVKEIDCSNMNISSLKGIDNFTSLERLYCPYNNLTSLDLSGNINLKEIECYENGLTSIVLPESTTLTSLSCGNNDLRSIDVSKNTNLMFLVCPGNINLGSLSVTYNSKLTTLVCSDCGITKLDIRKCKELERLDCSDNAGLKLILSTNNSALSTLFIKKTGIQDYSFMDYLNLQGFDCSGNGLSSLDLSSQRYLIELRCSDNKLSELNLKNNPYVISVKCSSNNIKALDLSNNKDLLELDFSFNQISKIDVSVCPKLTTISCNNNLLKTLDLSKHEDLTFVACNHNKLNNLDLTDCNKIITVLAEDNLFTSFDASNLQTIEYLNLNDNRLSSVKLDNPKLKSLYVSNNNLTYLSVKKCPSINYIDCSNNSLLGIDTTHRGADCRVDGFGQRVFLADVKSTNGKINMNDHKEMLAYSIKGTEGAHIEKPYLVVDSDMYAYYIYNMPSGSFTVTIATNNIPTLKSAKSAAKGVEVSWDVLGWANCYNVYRKDPGGSWTNIAKGISGNKYIDTTAVSGKTYYYTVRGLKENKSTYVGDYNRTGIKVKYIAAPKLTKAEAVATGVKVSFGAVNGAVNYSIHRKEGSGSWKKIGTTTGTSYIDKTAVKGKKYTYTVRCVSKDGSKYESAYDTKGLIIKYLAIPKLTKVAKVSTGVKVTFGAVSGASQYRIYRKEGSGSWKSIGTTTGTSYIDKTVVKGKKYTYTVRCISADGKTYESYYNTTGLSISYN